MAQFHEQTDIKKSLVWRKCEDDDVALEVCCGLRTRGALPILRLQTAV